MSRKLTKEIFIQRARKVHGNKYDYNRVVYKGTFIDVIIICPIHGEFKQIPNNHLNCKNGCPKCGMESSRLNQKNKSTKEEFAIKAKKVHGDRYNYDKVVYVNCKTDVAILCPIDGEFLQTPSEHLRGWGCPICGLKSRRLKRALTIDEFVKKARKIYKNKYNYSNVVYVNSHTNITIGCPIDGEFLQSPNSHLSGHGCPKCFFRKMAATRTLTTKEFISKAKKIHGDQYDYSKAIYTKSRINIKIICPIDGEFEQTPFKHLQGQGCPICKTSHGERLIAKILDSNRIKYIRQKTFKDCINPKTNYPLVYDFDLLELKMLIEFNGMQHYKEINYWHKNGRSLENQRERDQIKKDYAISHGYKFLVIKYDENIEEILNREVLC